MQSENELNQETKIQADFKEIEIGLTINLGDYNSFRQAVRVVVPEEYRKTNLITIYRDYVLDQVNEMVKSIPKDKNDHYGSVKNRFERISNWITDFKENLISDRTKKDIKLELIKSQLDMLDKGINAIQNEVYEYKSKVDDISDLALSIASENEEILTEELHKRLQKLNRSYEIKFTPLKD